MFAHLASREDDNCGAGILELAAWHQREGAKIAQKCQILHNVALKRLNAQYVISDSPLSGPRRKQHGIMGVLRLHPEATTTANKHLHNVTFQPRHVAVSFSTLSPSLSESPHGQMKGTVTGTELGFFFFSGSEHCWKHLGWCKYTSVMENHKSKIDSSAPVTVSFTSLGRMASCRSWPPMAESMFLYFPDQWWATLCSSRTFSVQTVHTKAGTKGF